MALTDIFWIIVALVASIGLSYYQYLYKSKRSKLFFVLASLRFLTLFTAFLLIINPKIISKKYEEVKTPLVIAIDNSESISFLKSTDICKEIVANLSNNEKLKDKFSIESITFGNDIKSIENIDFKDNFTRIDKLSSYLNNFYKNKKIATLLLTDGNQTQGQDYAFSFSKNNFIYPIVLGDTTTFADLKISHLNANKYAFHQNKFPVEIFVQYVGDKSISTNLIIESQGNKIHQQQIDLDSKSKSKNIQVLLDASKVGIQLFKASLSPLDNERNQFNNVKNFAVEVLDQKTEIAIVSDIKHPDIGALRRSIEKNAKYSVKLYDSKSYLNAEKADLVIVYQPNISFKGVFDKIKSSNTNYWLVTGLHTDFNFLNNIQSVFSFKQTSAKEDYLADYKSSFSSFSQEDLFFSGFSPLQHPFGEVNLKEKVDVLLESKIRNFNTGNPLLFYTDNNSARNIILLGENIWKWRLEYYENNNSFELFDQFIHKNIQYLATNNQKKSLVVSHESFYNSGELIEISAQYFDKNYQFDVKANLVITITNQDLKTSKNYQMVRGSNNYKIDLNGLSAGKYQFTVKETQSNTIYTSNFEIIDFNAEKQYTSPDVYKLNELSENNNGNVFYPNTINNLIEFLLNSDNFKITQKEITKRLPLIDFKWLLSIFIILLATEWFTRKYNGLL